MMKTELRFNTVIVVGPELTDVQKKRIAQHFDEGVERLLKEVLQIPEPKRTRWPPKPKPWKGFFTTDIVA